MKYIGGRRSIDRAARGPEPKIDQPTGHQMSWQGLYLRRWPKMYILYYISLLSGYGNQCTDPINNNKDCRVGQLTRQNGRF